LADVAAPVGKAELVIVTFKPLFKRFNTLDSVELLVVATVRIPLLTDIKEADCAVTSTDGSAIVPSDAIPPSSDDIESGVTAVTLMGTPDVVP
jgi:hypothetical protein